MRPLPLPPAEEPGLYIHVPFCQTKCPYCDFYSVTSRKWIREWIHSIKKEAEHYHGAFHIFDTFYLGGGTPSLLSSEQITKVFTLLRATFTFSPSCEITLEVNPDDVSAEKLHAWRALGIDRISVGAQSFRQEETHFLKRRHTAREAERALENIRRAGFANLSVDLMYGLPGQSISHWLFSLKRALEFEPEHLSCYQLTVEKNTALGRLEAQGKLSLPLEENQRRFFLVTSRFLERHGYVHYEISNFARSEDLQSRHNTKYWKHVGYLGLGPGAHSFLAGKRWWNVRSVRRYCSLLSKEKLPVEGEEVLTPDQLLLESLCFGFRTQRGIDLQLIDGNAHMRAVAKDLEQSCLVTQKGKRLAPTRKGFLVADSLPLRMLH